MEIQTALSSSRRPWLCVDLNLSILKKPCPLRQRHVHPGNATSIPATPRAFWRQCRPLGDSVDLSMSLLSLVGLSRCWQASPVVGTSLPTSPRLCRPLHDFGRPSTFLDAHMDATTMPRPSRRHHVHFGGTTSIPAAPCPSWHIWTALLTSRRPCTISDDAGRSPTMQDAHKPFRTFSNPPGRSLTLQGVL